MEIEEAENVAKNHEIIIAVENGQNYVEKRKQFGSRYLTDESDTYNYNAWDNVEWSDEQRAQAEAKVAEQRCHPLDLATAQRLLCTPNQQWQSFYEKHAQKFFMNRNWILTEFPELDTSNKWNGGDGNGGDGNGGGGCGGGGGGRCS